MPHLNVARDSVSEPLASTQLQLDCRYDVCPGSLSRSSCEAMRPRNVAGGAAWEGWAHQVVLNRNMFRTEGHLSHCRSHVICMFS